MAGLLPVATSFAAAKLHLGYRRLSMTARFPGRDTCADMNSTTRRDATPAREPLFDACDAGGSSLGRMGCRRGPGHGLLCPCRRHGAAVMTAALMVQGTGSDVGKSLIVAGLARA
jgi:hypothetical protein